MSLNHASVNAEDCVSVDEFAITVDDFDITFPDDRDVLPTPKVGRKKKLQGLKCLYLAGERSEVDFIFAQRPTRDRSGKLQRPEYFPGKRFRVGETGRKEKVGYNASGWFQTWCYAVDDIASLHQALEAVRLCKDSHGEPGYVIAGELAPWASERSAPRSKRAASRFGRKKPQGLVDAVRWWLVLDIDKVANLLGIDPRESAEARAAVIDYLRSFLPPELRYAACSWQLSSSCCVFGPDGIVLPQRQAPSRLGAHLRFWLDTGLDEAARKTLLLRIAQYVRAAMMSQGIDAADGAGVDAACATYNQAIFLSASFEEGVSDPLPERSGLATGTAEVLVGELELQLPELPAKAKGTRAKLTEEEKAANRERRAHDRLLRGARRTTSVAPGPRKPETDPILGIRLRRRSTTKGPQERVLQTSRWGKLHDIVRLTEDRRGRVPGWENGIPVGQRRKTMLLVAGLLSHFVPVLDLRAAIDSYGEALTSRGWMDEEWHFPKRDEHIIMKAELAEAAERAGGDGSRLRDDPWRERIMDLMQPDYEEMIRLRLRSLRTDAARKEVARRDAGKRTVDELREHRATASEAATRPWEAMGISESTYRRRKRTERLRALAEATDLATAKLSERGLADLRAFVQLAAVPEHRESLERLADGPLSAIRHENLAPGVELHTHLGSRAVASSSRRLADAAFLIGSLSDAARTDEATAEIIRWVLTGNPRYLEWAHKHDDGQRVHSVVDIIATAELHPRPAVFLARETPVTVGASISHCNGCCGEGGGQTDLAFPGVQEAGCSRATWYRREAALRQSSALEAASRVAPPSPRETSKGMW